MGTILSGVSQADLELVGKLADKNITADQVADGIKKMSEVVSSSSEIDNEIKYNHTPKSALDALSQASKRRVDMFMIGDSNQQMDGYGFRDGLKTALYNRFGQYASEITSGLVSGATINDAGEPFDSLSIDSYLNVSDGDTVAYNSYSGISVLNTINNPAGNFDTTSNIRVHLSYGTFSTGNGSFTPFVRKEESGWDHIQTEATINNNTGTDGIEKTSFDLPSDQSRDYQLGFKWTKYQQGYDIQGPFIADLMRVENLDADAGISVHQLFGSGGYNLQMMYSSLDSKNQQSQINYFAEMRRLQIEKGYKPIVVAYINSGFNDRNSGATSVGWRAVTDGDSAEAYLDNTEAIMNMYQSIWQSQGWDDTELYFLICPSHPISTLDDEKIVSYRSAINSLTNNKNCSVIDFTNLTNYQEMYDNYWYKDRDTQTIHLSQEGYIELSKRIVNLIN